MPSSKVGSVLLLISGSITLIIAAVLLIMAIAVPFLDGTEGDPVVGVVLFSIFFIFALVSGLIKLWASRLMKNPQTTNKGGIVALIIGILNSDGLSIIGGILGIAQGGK